MMEQQVSKPLSFASKTLARKCPPVDAATSPSSKRIAFEPTEPEIKDD
jgi:hypothetical protein